MAARTTGAFTDFAQGCSRQSINGVAAYHPHLAGRLCPEACSKATELSSRTWPAKAPPRFPCRAKACPCRSGQRKPLLVFALQLTTPCTCLSDSVWHPRIIIAPCFCRRSNNSDQSTNTALVAKCNADFPLATGLKQAAIQRHQTILIQQAHGRLAQGMRISLCGALFIIFNPCAFPTAND